MSRFIPLLVLTACFEPEVACTDLAAASALIRVVGEDGAPLVAELVAVDEDGNDVPVTCATDTAECTEWIVGYEVAGIITVTADAWDGCNDGTGTVTVDVPLDEDGCHVVQQEATLAVTEWTDLGCE